MVVAVVVAMIKLEWSSAGRSQRTLSDCRSGAEGATHGICANWIEPPLQPSLYLTPFACFMGCSQELIEVG